MQQKQKIILDVDTGHDDAVAIMLAAKSPCIDLLAVTVSAGNARLENTLTNTLNVCQALGLAVPVYAGCEAPIVQNFEELPYACTGLHGKSGLDGPVFAPLAKKPQAEHASLAIVREVMASEGDITIVTTGPMTNVAMAVRLEPRILPKIRRFLIFGGTYQLGNVTPAAEFNFFGDPEAGHILLTAGRPVTLCTLDVSRKTLCTPDILERLGHLDNPASKLFYDLMLHFCRTQKEVFGWEGAPLHDPIPIACLIDPGLVTFKDAHVKVDLRSTDSYGRTNCDMFGLSGLVPNAQVSVDIDVQRYWHIIEEGIRGYNN